MLNARSKKPSCANPASGMYPTSEQRVNIGAAPPLRHKKDLVGIRILHFSARRESFYIDVFARRIRALHQMGFSGDGNSIRIVSLRDLCGCNLCRRRSRGRRRRRCRLHWRRTAGLNWSVWIERLLLGRILCSLGGGIPRRPMVRSWRWRFFRTTSEQEGRKKRKQQ